MHALGQSCILAIILCLGNALRALQDDVSDQVRSFRSRHLAYMGVKDFLTEVKPRGREVNIYKLFAGQHIGIHVSTLSMAI